jgi:DNA-directed RNA polymerase subunit M/transcription elongation factor TFIIS
MQQKNMHLKDHQAANLISCPSCGNDEDFFEVAENVIITTHYLQNPDGSFTPEEDSSQILGPVRLICGECEEDLTAFHQRFTEMLF